MGSVAKVSVTSLEKKTNRGRLFPLQNFSDVAKMRVTSHAKSEVAGSNPASRKAVAQWLERVRTLVACSRPIQWRQGGEDDGYFSMVKSPLSLVPLA